MELVRGLPYLKSKIPDCRACQQGKQSRLPFKQSTWRATEKLQLIHMDVAGPHSSPSLNGSIYDDNLTPLVSLIPIEDQEGLVEYIEPHVKAAVIKHENSPTNLQQYITSETSLINSQCSGKTKLVAITYSETEVVAASALIVASMASNEIDMDLLAEIFNDPVMIEKLVEKHRIAITLVKPATAIATSYAKPAKLT
ncbi:hypothetical protein CR513_61431, partial [Mucuna pruriens]